MKIFQFLIAAFIAVALMAIAIPAKSPPEKQSLNISATNPAQKSALVDTPVIRSESGKFHELYAANPPNAAKNRVIPIYRIKWQKHTNLIRPPDRVKLE
jgi:hypothetical protein